MAPRRTEAATRAQGGAPGASRSGAEAGGCGRGRRIPEELWRAAVDLAGEDGVWRTARGLRLNNRDLKQRLVPACGAGDGARPGGAFIELPPTIQGASAGCVVELEDRQGTRMRVELLGWVATDAVALARKTPAEQAVIHL
jgi:hypothetical protein